MHLLLGFIVSILAISARGAPSSYGSGYELKKGPLDTPWTTSVGTNPWPEYPRPQLERSAQWKNLNGVWSYQNATSENELQSPPFGQPLSSSVLVPFCLESALSGVMSSWHIWSWYSTSFEIDPSWSGKRVLLNFGAVDYEATVFVNGKNVGFHRGGYWAFTLDITDALSSGKSNELLVWVYDPTDKDQIQIPIGKQTLDPSHIFYTPCSGIWQTVWLEAAPANYVSQLDLIADMDGQVNVTVHNSNNKSTPVDIIIYEQYPNNDKVKATANGTSGSSFQFKVDSPKLWSPNTPDLYNISIKMGDDTIKSYTGFRTISRGVIDGVQRPLLNGEFVFMFGTLDQGFWPDGIYTPPSYEAMIWDITMLKEVGYNMLRKHIKVEPALFYYACDKLGLLLFQDMPSLRTSVTNPNDKCQSVPILDPAVQEEFNRQLAVHIEQHKNYPSIVAWIIYNEGWGQNTTAPYIEFPLTDLVRSIDPTRLINSVTGWHEHGAGDYSDNHHYSYPQCGTPFYSLDSPPYDPSKIAIQGEFGGIGNNVSIANLWNVAKSINDINRTYELDDTVKIWNYRAHLILEELRQQIEMFACSAAIWTQTTDVEGEVNGMVTYDRRVNRMDKTQWAADIKALYSAAASRGGANATMSVTHTLV